MKNHDLEKVLKYSAVYARKRYKKLRNSRDYEEQKQAEYYMSHACLLGSLLAGVVKLNKETDEFNLMNARGVPSIHPYDSFE